MPAHTAVRVPDLGDFKAVDVIDVLVRVGDVVAVDSPLATLETEKATMDVPSTAAGRVAAVLIKKGDKVSTGSPVVELEPLGGAAEALDPTVQQPALDPTVVHRAFDPTVMQPALDPTVLQPALDPTVLQPALVPGQPPPTPAVAPVSAAAPAAVADAVIATPLPAAPAAMLRSEIVTGLAPVEEVGFARAYASPSVRLLARELGVDLAGVTGTGPKSRILHADVKAWVKRALAGADVTAPATGAALPSVPVVDYAKFGPVEVQPLTRIQRISARRLHASWVSLPHVTQFDEADITALDEARGRLKQKALDEGVKLTPLAFVMRACVRVLKQFPRFNASLDPAGENLVVKKYLHLGFAADTPNGLVVPVVRDADRRNLYQLARELALLSEKARAGKLAAAEMQGGCFTVSSLGGIGGTAFTPIINAPEVAILGVSRSITRPVFVDGQFVPRLMLPLSLSYDHRVIDGAEAARFTTALVAALADVRALLESVA